MSQWFCLLSASYHATHFSAELRPWTLQTSGSPSLITLSLLCVYQSFKALLADTEETLPPKPICLYDLCGCLPSPLTSLIAQEPEQHSSAYDDAVQTVMPQLSRLTFESIQLSSALFALTIS